MRAVTAMSFQGVTFMISQPLPAAAPCGRAVVAPHRQEQSQDPVLPVLPRPRSEHRLLLQNRWWGNGGRLIIIILVQNWSEGIRT